MLKYFQNPTHGCVENLLTCINMDIETLKITSLVPISVPVLCLNMIHNSCVFSVLQSIFFRIYD